MTPVAADSDVKASRTEAWRYFRRFYRSSYPSLALSVVISILQSVVLVPIAALVGYVFDTVLPAGDLAELITSAAAMLALYLSSGVLALWTRHVGLKTTKLAVMGMRLELLEHLYAQPSEYHDAADTGHLHTVIVQDSERVDVMSYALVAVMIPTALTSILLCVVLAVIDLRLFLVMIVALPIMLVLREILGKRVRRLVQAYHESFEGFSRGVIVGLRTLVLMRTRSAEAFELLRQRRRMDDLRRTSQSMAWLASAYAFVQEMMASGVGAVVLVFGGVAVASDRMTLGRLIAFYVIMGLLQTRVRSAAYNLQLVFEGAEALFRLHRLATDGVSPPYEGSEEIAFEGGVELSGITFGYPRRQLLDGIDLSVRPGEIVALVGGNGAGKTTIGSLVLGFYRPHGGVVSADGAFYDTLDLPHLRRQMGVVHQEPLLFPDTIAANIAYDRIDVDREEIEAAARLATADLFVSELPDGYGTRIGEDGHLLSRGERQRIALARALLGSPRLLVLDEPTSNLDDNARGRLLDNLLALDPRPAMLLITHDPELVLVADRVAVLRDGRIVARGTPDELAAAGALSPVTSMAGHVRPTEGNR